MDFKKLNFPKAPYIKVAPPGPEAKRLIKIQSETEGNAVYYPKILPFVPDSGLGATLKDVDGNVYIDFSAGVSVLNFGHANPYVLGKATEQLKKITHTLDFPTVARTELVKRLIRLAPGEMNGNARVVFGGPTGSDAVESAVKLAKFYTKRMSMIAFHGSYHGQTTMALALTSEKKYREHYSPLGPEVSFAPYPNLYRNSFNENDPKKLVRLCVDYLTDMIESPDSGVSKPAAVIVEPIQGEGGIIVPPNDFLKEIEAVCRKNDVLLIADEIQTAFCRTGRWFASEYSGVNPDIITMAKSLGGIGLPISGIMYRKDLDIWGPGAHVGTFRGDAVAMAGGAAAIDFANDVSLLGHVNELGAAALSFLKDTAGESRFLGDVRGRGLFIGLEFVKDKRTKEPWKEFCDKLQAACFKKGVIIWRGGAYGNVIRLVPPLVITKELMLNGLETLKTEIKRLETSEK